MHSAPSNQVSQPTPLSQCQAVSAKPTSDRGNSQIRRATAIGLRLPLSMAKIYIQTLVADELAFGKQVALL